MSGKALEALVRGCAVWSATAALVLGLVLLAALLWAKRRGHSLFGSEAGGMLAPPVALPRWFVPLLALILIGALCLRLPRMGLSFYNDETHSYVRVIAGEWKDYGGGKERFRRPTWLETGFRNSTGNNGFFFSLLARAGHDSWRAATGAADGAVREWPVRLPSLIAGILTIAGLAAAGGRAGFPGAGLAAAGLAAVHPWHVRYSTEARGYALMMLALVLGYWLLLRALQTSRWRDWIGHGVVQFLALWANLGALFAVGFGQLGVGVFLIWQWRVKRVPGAARHVAGWVAGGVVAVLLAGCLLAPGIIQLQKNLQDNPSLVGTVLPGWWRDTLVYLANGCAWAGSADGNPVNPVASGHWLRLAGIAAFYGLVAAGCVTAVRRPSLRLPLMLACLQGLSLVPLYLRSSLGGNVLFWWYALPALPGLLLLAGFAFAGAGPLRRSAAVLATLLVGLSAATVLAPVLRHSKGDGRALVRQARGGDFPDYDQRAITLDLWSDAVTYDPLARWADDVGMVRAEAQRAAAAGVPLYVYVGHEGKARETHPEVLGYLHSPGFALVRTAWGLESPTNDNRLYLWTGRQSPAPR